MFTRFRSSRPPARTSIPLLTAACLLGVTAVDEPALAPTPPAMTTPATSGLPGMVRPARAVVLSAPEDGLLLEVYVEEGDRIDAGTLVARMDDRLAAAAREVAALRAGVQAAVDEASTTLRHAVSIHDRVAALHAAGDATEQELLDAARDRALAEARHRRALENRRLDEARLRQAAETVAAKRITAPFDGVVVECHATAGSTLKLADPVVELVNLEHLEAELYLPLERYGTLAPGERLSLRAGPPVDAPLEGVVRFISPRIEGASGTFRCVVELENRDGALPAGFRVWAAATDAVADATP